MVVLLLAPRADDQAKLVAEALDDRGTSPMWFDTSWFPMQASAVATLTPDGWRGSLHTPLGEVDIAAVSAIYHRQSQPFILPGKMSQPEQSFARVEARFGLGGLFSSLSAHWVSHPSRMADAEYKPFQFTVAKRAGFELPETLITNDVEEVREFVEQMPDGIVYKPVMNSLVSEAGSVKVVYTTPDDISRLDGQVSLTMHMYQRNIPKTM